MESETTALKRKVCCMHVGVCDLPTEPSGNDFLLTLNFRTGFLYALICTLGSMDVSPHKVFSELSGLFSLAKSVKHTIAKQCYICFCTISFNYSHLYELV